MMDAADIQHTQLVESAWLFREIIAHLVSNCGINSFTPFLWSVEYV